MFEQVGFATSSACVSQNTPTSQFAANALTRLREAFAVKPFDESFIEGAVCSYVAEMKKMCTVGGNAIPWPRCLRCDRVA
jgi:hypothetical protein